MKSKKQSYRLEITGRHVPMSPSYIVRHDGSVVVNYFSGSEQSLALSNLVGNSAAMLRFHLEDAIDGREAAHAVRAILMQKFANNRAAMPTVTILN